MKPISLIGLGKLGLPLTACFAQSGVKVIGIDKEQERITLLREKKTPFYEPHLDETLLTHINNVKFSTSTDEAVTESDTTIVLVNTPSSEDDRAFSNTHINEAIKSCAQSLRDSDKEYHLFIISSTVMPGSCINEFVPIIENNSGRKLNRGFGLVHIPDLVALGSVINDFKNPDLLIVGASDQKAFEHAMHYYKKLINKETPIKSMSLTEAELTKVSLNAYITMKLSFANFIGNVCEELGEANADNITSALGLDKRIGAKYFKSGPAFGGTCFPRDTWAFLEFAKHLNLDPSHIQATEQINGSQKKRLCKKVTEALYQTGTNSVSILGAAFKTDTAVITESVFSHLAPYLLERGTKIYTYDSLAETAINNAFPDAIRDGKIVVCSSELECIEASLCCVLALAEPAYKKALLLSQSQNRILIDCWRNFAPNEFNGIYWPVGAARLQRSKTSRVQRLTATTRPSLQFSLHTPHTEHC